MKRLLWLLAPALGVIGLWALAGPLHVAAQDGGHGESGDFDPAVLRGAAVYAEFCQACHGPDGTGAGSGAAFVALKFDAESAADVVANGADRTPDDGAAMPAYGKALSDAQRSDVIAYLAALDQHEAPALPEPNVATSVEHVPDYFGDVHAGAAIYAKFCAGCHGATGQGRGVKNFPKLKFDANHTRATAAAGTDSLVMPGFGAAAGGPLDDQQLTDLETYLASWALDVPQEGENGVNSGVAVMIVVFGAATVLGVGFYYLARGSAHQR